MLVTSSHAKTAASSFLHFRFCVVISDSLPTKFVEGPTYLMRFRHAFVRFSKLSIGESLAV